MNLLNQADALLYRTAGRGGLLFQARLGLGRTSLAEVTNIEEALKDLRDASDNLFEAMGELRSAPDSVSRENTVRTRMKQLEAVDAVVTRLIRENHVA